MTKEEKLKKISKALDNLISLVECHLYDSYSECIGCGRSNDKKHKKDCNAKRILEESRGIQNKTRNDS